MTTVSNIAQNQIAFDYNNLTREQLVALVGEGEVLKLEQSNLDRTEGIVDHPDDCQVRMIELYNRRYVKIANGDEIRIEAFHYKNQMTFDDMSNWEYYDWTPHHYTYVVNWWA